MPACPVDGLCVIDALQDRISHDARVPADSVRKGVNVDKPVMQADRCFRRRIGFVFSSVAGVVHQRAQFHADMDWVDADTLDGAPE
jgi:hypothetical protein